MALPCHMPHTGIMDKGISRKIGHAKQHSKANANKKQSIETRKIKNLENAFLREPSKK